jgi:hypothetical protein
MNYKNLQTLLALIMCLLFFAACNKSVEIPSAPVVKEESKPSIASFVQYVIPQGQQYCMQNAFTAADYSQLKFVVKFDSSAIYTTQQSSNQGDINKLYGFSDNNSQHHLFSARFGWRWKNNALELFGYIYNDGTMSFTSLGTVAIGSEHQCSISVNEQNYVFTLNGVSTTMPRSSKTIKASGYKLFPYFGGDESAPHEIKIWIKEL